MPAKSDIGGYPPWDSAIEPAPGDLRIVQAFVNTNDLDSGVDVLKTPDDLRAWMELWRLAPSGPTTDLELHQAVELREGLRELLLRNNGEEGGAHRLAALETCLSDLPLRCRLTASGAFELEAVGTGWQGAAARLLTVVTRSIGDGTWERLKACRRNDCQWVFYDASKNRSGKWCAMAGCGDLMKARAYRERKRLQATRRE